MTRNLDLGGGGSGIVSDRAATAIITYPEITV
jgi:hypothetical protein